jgi:hypothetical protein
MISFWYLKNFRVVKNEFKMLDQPELMMKFDDSPIPEPGPLLNMLQNEPDDVFHQLATETISIAQKLTTAYVVFGCDQNQKSNRLFFKMRNDGFLEMD